MFEMPKILCYDRYSPHSSLNTYRRETFQTGPYGKEYPTDSLKFHAGPPCPTLIRAAGGPPYKWPYGCLGGGLRPSSSPLDTPSRTGLLSNVCNVKSVSIPIQILTIRSVREGVSMDSLKFHPAPPCLTLLRGRLLPSWIPFPVRACFQMFAM
jgi:hypothetical protein